ncbi:MAG TPA: PorT family protein [Lutibacter sp.]|nr:PorT family protein [Lutibacter sp.]
MKQVISFFISLLTTSSIFSQDSLLVGKKYFEDQIYVGITYNTLTYEPKELEQKGISTGFQFGFIKDIPLNKKGSFAFALGLGYSFNSYNHNIRINQEEPLYTFIENTYQKNKLITHSIELPFELRFRLTSSPTIYQFWRIYIGGKIGYIYSSNTHFVDELSDVKIRKLSILDQIYYGPQIAIGYNAVNVYAYYNLNPIFIQSESSDNVGISDVKKISVGLQFYIF